MPRIASILVLSLSGLALAQVPDMPDIPPLPATVPAPVTPPQTTSAPTTTTAPSPISEFRIQNSEFAPPTSAPATTSAPSPISEFRIQNSEFAPSAPATPPALRLSFTADHPSNLYYSKEDAHLDVIVENPSAVTLPFTGSIDFGPEPVGNQSFKPTSITPIAATTVDAGQRLKLSITATVPSPGNYVLRCNNQSIAPATGNPLLCIFAPRGLDSNDSPWLAVLPPSAADTPGLLADFAQRSGIRRYLLDETWSPNGGGGGGGGGADAPMLTLAQRATLFADLAAAKIGGGAKCELILRVALAPAADVKHVAAFHEHVSSLVTASKGAITAVVLDAGHAVPNADQVDRFRAYYLAAYDAARKANKSQGGRAGVLMLGAGSIVNTDLFLVAPIQETPASNLSAYVDIAAALDTPADVRRALERAAKTGGPKTPLWVLPGRTRAGVPAAALKAANAAVIPVTLTDRNVVPHLLGGTVATEHLHEGTPPYIAIFQGDGYAVAAIAGLGAGTLLDADPVLRSLVFPPAPAAEKPTLSAATLTTDATTGSAPEPATLEVADDARALNVVDSAGSTLPCRTGDILDIPLSTQVAYLLTAGAAEDLTSLLRTATPHGTPSVAVTLTTYKPATPDHNGLLNFTLKNITPANLTGSIHVLSTRLNPGQNLAEDSFRNLAPNKTIDVSLPLPYVDAPNPTLDITINRHHQLHTITTLQR